ncbi:segregation and condensation protein A [Alteromonas oceanisediminis]|uniref:segregation and condensation protein A n=1 Tax=Alteromonas oceanisediminis TaxID=2836180 RepID=UPI001BDADCD3|nr:ScpA family protein [Alteromonas oceanisediminis]MBT0588063.1 segregation/condensation protein A [Alteromonas oceanisediminis]
MADDTRDPIGQEPVQQPLPLAFVHGEALIEKPEDLYIPPDALEVILDSFEGPLDLLLYLIRKQKFDIVSMPVLKITQQYMQYVDVMQELKLELAAEYLLMAAILAEIKSRLLLPKRPAEEEDEGDPRAELMRRLKEYEVIKKAAHDLDRLPRAERDHFTASAIPADSIEPIRLLPHTSLQELTLAFQAAMQRAKAFEHHHIAKETLSTRERMAAILQRLSLQQYTPMQHLYTVEEGRTGVVVTFLALLELTKEGLVDCIQAEAYSHVHVKLKSNDLL